MRQCMEATASHRSKKRKRRPGIGIEPMTFSSALSYNLLMFCRWTNPASCSYYLSSPALPRNQPYIIRWRYFVEFISSFSLPTPHTLPDLISPSFFCFILNSIWDKGSAWQRWIVLQSRHLSGRFTLHSVIINSRQKKNIPMFQDALNKSLITNRKCGFEDALYPPDFFVKGWKSFLLSVSMRSTLVPVTI